MTTIWSLFSFFVGFAAIKWECLFVDVGASLSEMVKTIVNIIFLTSHTYPKLPN